MRQDKTSCVITTCATNQRLPLSGVQNMHGNYTARQRVATGDPPIEYLWPAVRSSLASSRANCAATKVLSPTSCAHKLGEDSTNYKLQAVYMSNIMYCVCLAAPACLMSASTW